MIENFRKLHVAQNYEVDAMDCTDYHKRRELFTWKHLKRTDMPAIMTKMFVAHYLIRVTGLGRDD